MKKYSPSSAFAFATYILEPYPNYLSGKPHTGIDIYCRERHHLVAIEPGVITDVFPGSPSHVGGFAITGEETGHAIIYKHAFTHLKKGEKVVPGEAVGFLDNSGYELKLWAGYHLHFQIAYEKTPIDPVKYFTEYAPDMIYYMRENVFDIYRKRDYFDSMIIKERPF